MAEFADCGAAACEEDLEDAAAAAAAGEAAPQRPEQEGQPEEEHPEALPLPRLRQTAEQRAMADEWALATLRCAHLACTSLAGGSEAGLRSKRCSACRVVRYCCEHCQAADWHRHRSVCRLLRRAV